MVFLLPLWPLPGAGFRAGWLLPAAPVATALAMFFPEPQLHADVRVDAALPLGWTLDTKAGKSSSWKADLLAGAAYVKAMAEESVGAEVVEERLGKSSSSSLTGTGWDALRGERGTS